jgi:hypothetical protein
MKHAANVIPGQFEAKGHDRRADLARFVREVYGLNRKASRSSGRSLARFRRFVADLAAGACVALASSSR